MSPKMQRVATRWLLPVTLLVVSPLLLGAAWSKWRKRKEKELTPEQLHKNASSPAK
jgi:cytochrome c-type biogenesis protein CcmH/NrfF